jgi:eukaryotic-like serine/threonine-protein kinase
MSGCPSEDTVVDLVGGALSAAEASRVREHVDACAECRALVAVLCESPMATTEPHGSAGPPPDVATSGPGAIAPEPVVDTKNTPARVGRYELKKFLGAGGMGVVYEAYDPKLDRTVAVKVLRFGPDGGTLGGALSARMQREARAMARLKHPNVVAVYDVGEIGERPFITMELVSGTTLSAWRAEKPRSVREILSAYTSAGRGLAAAHDAGIVHRDFKPDNVLVGEGGEVRVTDFGLAQRAFENDALVQSGFSTSMRLTQSGKLVGTPAYMSPEQMRGQPATFQSDMFSFCAALYEAIHDVLPFEGTNVLELRDNVVAGRLRKDVRSSRTSWRIRRVLARGLRPNPGERFATMQDLLSELESAGRADRGRRAVAGIVALAVLGLALVTGRVAFRGSSSIDRTARGGEASRLPDLEVRPAVSEGANVRLQADPEALEMGVRNATVAAPVLRAKPEATQGAVPGPGSGDAARKANGDAMRDGARNTAPISLSGASRQPGQRPIVPPAPQPSPHGATRGPGVAPADEAPVPSWPDDTDLHELPQERH